MSDPMQVDSTAVAIALTIPEHCGNFPDVVFSILIKHFSVFIAFHVSDPRIYNMNTIVL